MPYFIHDGQGQKGPFSLEELANMNITPSTPVWKDGLSDWINAGDLDEVRQLVMSTPPKFMRPADSVSGPVTKKQKTEFNYLRFFVCIAIAVVLVYFFVKSRQQSEALSTFSNSFIQPDLEHTNPAKFLNAAGTYHPNFWNNEEVLNVVVLNTASHTNYKDVRIRVNFYSQTKSLITSQDYVFYDYVPYGATKNFKLKVNKPSATASCGWFAIGATYY